MMNGINFTGKFLILGEPRSVDTAYKFIKEENDKKGKPADYCNIGLGIAFVATGEKNVLDLHKFKDLRDKHFEDVRSGNEMKYRDAYNEEFTRFNNQAKPLEPIEVVEGIMNETLDVIG